MATTHPWINFSGNAEEAFTFYNTVLGGEITTIVRFKDLAGPEFPVAEEDANKIMQITLSRGSTVLLVGNDVPAFMGTVNERENRSKIHLVADTKEEAETFFAGLSVGGEVEVPIDTSSWGTYFGMFRDQYGIEWIVESKPSS